MSEVQCTTGEHVFAADSPFCTICCNSQHKTKACWHNSKKRPPKNANASSEKNGIIEHVMMTCKISDDLPHENNEDIVCCVEIPQENIENTSLPNDKADGMSCETWISQEKESGDQKMGPKPTHHSEHTQPKWA